jgi:hypothetical protein
MNKIHGCHGQLLLLHGRLKKKFYPETTSINVMQRGADAIC